MLKNKQRFNLFSKERLVGNKPKNMVTHTTKTSNHKKESKTRGKKLAMKQQVSLPHFSCIFTILHTVEFEVTSAV